MASGDQHQTSFVGVLEDLTFCLNCGISSNIAGRTFPAEPRVSTVSLFDGGVALVQRVGSSAGAGYLLMVAQETD